MKHFSASVGVFVRQKWNFFAERNLFLAAKTQISCRKGVHGSVESGEKRGFGRIFSPIWRSSACKIHLSFCKPFPSRADAGAALVRTVSRGGGKVSRKAGSGFHPAFPQAREVRAFPSGPVPASVCAILAGQVLTF